MNCRGRDFGFSFFLGLCFFRRFRPPPAPSPPPPPAPSQDRILFGLCLDCVWCFEPTVNEYEIQAAEPEFLIFRIAQNGLKPCSGERARKMLPIALKIMEKGALSVELWRFEVEIQISAPMSYITSFICMDL